MNMQMLFTFYHMVLFQVITRRTASPLINMKGWSENTVYQETPGACVRGKCDRTDTRLLESISSRSINIHVDGSGGLISNCQQQKQQRRRFPSFQVDFPSSLSNRIDLF